MIPTDLSSLANHLWQSTIFAAAAWLLTLVLRKNRAAVRYRIWLAASVKFLVPFSVLIRVGSQLPWRSAPLIPQPQFADVMDQIGQPFTASPVLSALATAPSPGDLAMILSGAWFCGSVLGLIFWIRLSQRFRAVLRSATTLDLGLPIPVVSSPARLEPGVYGIRRPVLLLPQDILSRLTPAQLETVLAHELCHVRRRDNLTAAIQMIVEVIFWFHPLVWWVRTKLVSERERACDEEVVQSADDPQVYAEAILNVCRVYMESPLVCVSGVTGANLRRRIEAIVSNHIGRRLNRAKKLLLASAGAAALAVPLMIGIAHAPAVRAQSGSGLGSTGKALSFGVASIKPHIGGWAGSGGGPPQDLRFTPGKVASGPPGVTARKIILEAFHLAQYQLSGGPSWVDSDRLDLEAKAEGANENQLKQMLQTMLAERFQLAVHRESKDMKVYDLTVGKKGPQLLKTGSEQEDSARVDRIIAGARASGGTVMASRKTMEELVDWLNALDGQFDRPIIDRTGLPGKYLFVLPFGPGQDYRTAIEETLGLKFVPARTPVDVYVIDRIQKPAPN